MQLVELPVAGRVCQSSGLSLDRDAALALEVHRVQHLLTHLPVREAAAALDEAVGERRLAMVDVRDDRKVADVLHGRCGLRPAGWPRAQGLYAKSRCLGKSFE